MLSSDDPVQRKHCGVCKHNTTSILFRNFPEICQECILDGNTKFRNKNEDGVEEHRKTIDHHPYFEENVT